MLITGLPRQPADQAPANGSPTEAHADLVPLFFDGGVVLVDETHSRLHVLNAGAAAIWTLRRRLLLPRVETARLLCDHYGLARGDAEAAIEAAEQGWAEAGVGLGASVNKPSSDSPRSSADMPRDYYDFGRFRVLIACDDVESRARLQALLHDKVVSPCPADLTVHVTTTSDDRLRVVVDGVDRLVAQHSGEVVGFVFQSIVERAHPDRGCLAWIHAAASATDGKVLLFPGHSGAGKTTLAAYLAMHGYRHIADDLVALDVDGGIVSWTPPLCVKSDSWPLLSPHYPSITTLPEQTVLQRRVKYLPAPELVQPNAPYAPDAIVFPRWTRGATPTLKRMSSLQAMARLVSERLWLGYPLRRENVRRFLDWLAEKPVYHLQYETLEGAARQLALLSAAPVSRDRTVAFEET